MLGTLHSRGGVGRRRETNMFQMSDEKKVHQELQHTEIPENFGYSYPFFHRSSANIYIKLVKLHYYTFQLTLLL